MNFVDLLIVVFIVLAVFRGARLGVLNLAFSAAGFLLGLYVGSLLAGLVSSYITSASSRLFIGIVINLLVAFVFAGIGEVAGTKLGNGVEKIHFGKANKLLGSVFEVGFTLLVAWFLGSAVANLKTANVGASVRHSAIISELNRILPPSPDFLSNLGKVIDSSGFPRVFIGNEPDPRTVIRTTRISTPEIKAAESSIVKVEGYGCGGILEGSGFAIDSNIIVTNAHVIAGVANPKVVSGGKVYDATAIWFDQNMDLAMLKVTDLNLTPLRMSDAIKPDGSDVVIMGYPGGGPLTISGGVILDHITAEGRNIYDRGIVNREIYQVQTEVEPGNSGGPLLDDHANVVGVVFAKSVTNNAVGYALLTAQLTPSISQALSQQAPVVVGRCLTE